jgi:hypothetical protein
MTHLKLLLLLFLQYVNELLCTTSFLCGQLGWLIRPGDAGVDNVIESRLLPSLSTFPFQPFPLNLSVNSW